MNARLPWVLLKRHIQFSSVLCHLMRDTLDLFKTWSFLLKKSFLQGLFCLTWFLPLSNWILSYVPVYTVILLRFKIHGVMDSSTVRDDMPMCLRSRGERETQMLSIAYVCIVFVVITQWNNKQEHTSLGCTWNGSLLWKGWPPSQRA